MSASNWKDCPRCADVNRAAEAQRNADIAAAYGTVSEADYRDMVESPFRPPRPDNSLREDWDVGMWMRPRPHFEVSYGAACQTTGCGFTFTFHERQEVKP